MTDLAAKAAANLNVPQGITGTHRDQYLALPDAQKARFRYWFIACGKYAATAFEIVQQEAANHD